MSVYSDCCEQHEKRVAAIHKAVRAVLDRVYIFGLPGEARTPENDHQRSELAKAFNELEKLCPR